jgi:hypothetical protein
MRACDGLVVQFEKHVRRELTSFLGEDVGNPVATVFDTWVNVNEGVLKGATGMALGVVDLDPRWFLIDPDGAADTWSGMAKSMWKGSLINALLNPREAGEADLQQLKSLLHLDDWSAARPGLGLGENVFDVATMFIPGAGEAGAAADGAEAAARGARAAEESAEAADGAGTAGKAGDLAAAGSDLGAIGTTGGDLTKDLESATADLPELPVGGAPVSLPPDGLSEAPVESAVHPADPAPGAPPSTTPPEAVRQAGEPVPELATAPHDPVSVPTGGAHEPVGGTPSAIPAPVSGSPAIQSVQAVGGRLPSAVPQLVDHSPARVPLAPSGSHVESEHVIAHSSHAAPAPSSAAPHFAAPSARPPELPASGSGGWHGPGDGEKAGGPPRHGSPPGREKHGHGDHSLKPKEPSGGESNKQENAYSDNGTGGEPHAGSDLVGPCPLPAPELVAPPPDGAFFWSGRTSDGLGIGPASAGGNGAADMYAGSHGGTTLERLLDRNGVVPPKWSFDDSAAQEWWSEVSKTYAENARGEVYAVIGSNLRPGSVWETVELPRLMDNPNVTKIVIIDPQTGGETIVYER